MSGTNWKITVQKVAGYRRNHWPGIAGISIRHIVVDEMQDYVPIQYAILYKTTNCKMTFLGDFNQSLNPFTKNSTKEILKIFPYADLVSLNNSYRSTYEIVNFAQRIIYNKDLIAIERHGDFPVIESFNNLNDEIKGIMDKTRDFTNEKKYNSLAIICKNDRELYFLYEKFKEQNINICLLDSNCTTFSNGIILTNAYLSKGLEFDSVIIPFVNLTNYATDIDKSMLYISCTRAMHQLSITYTDQISSILNNGLS